MMFPSIAFEDLGKKARMIESFMVSKTDMDMVQTNLLVEIKATLVQLCQIMKDKQDQDKQDKENANG